MGKAALLADWHWTSVHLTGMLSGEHTMGFSVNRSPLKDTSLGWIRYKGPLYGVAIVYEQEMDV